MWATQMLLSSMQDASKLWVEYWQKFPNFDNTLLVESEMKTLISWGIRLLHSEASSLLRCQVVTEEIPCMRTCIDAGEAHTYYREHVAGMREVCEYSLGGSSPSHSSLFAPDCSVSFSVVPKVQQHWLSVSLPVAVVVACWPLRSFGSLVLLMS